MLLNKKSSWIKIVQTTLLNNIYFYKCFFLLCYYVTLDHLLGKIYSFATTELPEIFFNISKDKLALK